MWLEELLETIPIGEKVAVKIDQDVKVDEVQQLLFWARKDAIAHIEEVLPNGYTDGNGISYLQITCEDVRERGDEDSLPFPAFEQLIAAVGESYENYLLYRLWEKASATEHNSMRIPKK